MLVEILSIPDCRHTEAALALVDQAARSLGVAPIVNLVELSSLEQASDRRLTGSPTIRVAGRDVQDTASDEPPWISCRLSMGGHAGTRLPDLNRVISALREAGASL